MPHTKLEDTCGFLSPRKEAHPQAGDARTGAGWHVGMIVAPELDVLHEGEGLPPLLPYRNRWQQTHDECRLAIRQVTEWMELDPTWHSSHSLRIAGASQEEGTLCAQRKA